ncbi:MAG: response regulator transcription factor [Gammaproteobacteria bacterium]|nr:response regulator transcription factor [Gammaproteobacteria bacterium]
MRLLLADDEAPARARLRSLLGEIGADEIVGEAANGREALELADRLRPDVVLLDIRMPGIDGIEAAGHLAGYEQPPAVIFTTAYGDYALEAFEMHAVDYLLKPIRRQRLAEALAKARRLSRSRLDAVRDMLPGAPSRTHICARARGQMVLIPVKEIIYFRADHKYVTVRHLHGEVLIEEPLKDLAEEFAGRFLRIHRNTLIAVSFLAGLTKTPDGLHMVSLRGVEERPEVSRRHLFALKELLKRYG